MKTPPEIIHEWLMAVNAHDPGRVAALYHDDAHFVDIALGRLVEGRHEIAAYFTEIYRAFPTWSKETHGMHMCGNDWGILEWKANGAFLGPFDRFEPTGRSFALRGCGVFQFANEQIVNHRRYWDTRRWYEQLGLRA